MQNRKELAEAGRRKLAEFRKAKAQGKAVTTASPSKPFHDAPAPPPPSKDKGTLPPLLPNDNGTGHPAPAPAPMGAAVPSLPPGTTADAISPHAYSAPNGTPPTSTSSVVPLPLEQRAAVASSAAHYPVGTPISTGVPNPASAPITTFVVLQDAPIPFGAPATVLPAGQGSPLNGDGSSWISSNGGQLLSCETSAAVGQPISVASCQGLDGSRWVSDQRPGASTVTAPEPNSLAASAWPLASLPGRAQGQLGASVGGKATNGPVESVASRLSDDVSFFDGTGGKDPSQGGESSLPLKRLFGVAASSSPSPFGGDPVHAGHKPHSSTKGSNALPSQRALPSVPTNGLDLHGAGQSTWQPAPGTKHKTSWSSSESPAAPEPRVVPDPRAQPDAMRLEVGTGGTASVLPFRVEDAEVISHVSATPDVWSLSRTPDCGLSPHATVDVAEVGPAARAFVPTAPAAAAPPPPLLPTPLNADVNRGTGYGGVSEVRQLDTRPPWLTYSEAIAPSVSPPIAASIEPPSTAAVAPAIAESLSSSMGHHAGPALRPQPGPLSSAKKEASDAAAPVSDVSLRPATTDAEATTSTSIAVAVGAVNGIPFYEQLSDSYLGSSGAGSAVGAPNAPSPVGEQVLPSGSQEGLKPLSGRSDDAISLGSAGAASPSMLISVAVTAATPSPAGADGADRNGTRNLTTPPSLATTTAGPTTEQPPSQPSPSPSPTTAAMLAAQPARAAPATSRFAWLFGSTQPAKQPPPPAEQPPTAPVPTTQQPSALTPSPLLAVQPSEHPLRAEPLSTPVQPWETASPEPAAPAPLPLPTFEPAPTQAYPPAAEDVDLLSAATRAAPDPSFSATGTAWNMPGAGTAHPLPLNNLFSHMAVSAQLNNNLLRKPVEGYSSTTLAFGTADGRSDRFDSAGVVGARDAPLRPSFLRDVDWPGTGSGREDRSAEGTVTPVMAVGSSGQSHDATSSSTAGAASVEFTSAPSFSTSFSPLPLPSTSLPPLPQVTASRLPPAGAPAPTTTAVTVGSMAHFSTATSYLSAYAGASPHGTASGAAATNTSTSSFLESYLDNLLSTMSTAARDGAEDPNAHTHRHAGGRAGESSTGPHLTRHSSAGTPRHSHTGDAPGEVGTAASEQHAAFGELESEGSEVKGLDNGGGMADKVLSSSDLIAGGCTGAGARCVLEGAGGSTHGEALSHVDNASQLCNNYSRRMSGDSAGVLSVFSHTAVAMHGGPGATARGPGGSSSSGISRTQFAALQQHIDELTEEKLVLARGLQQQTRINEQLAEENEELMRQFNSQGAAMEELQRKVKKYEQELEAQALSLEGFSEERHAARSSYAEASSRAQALAAEVVSLEAQVLQLKSAVLKAERTAEEAQQRAKRLEKQVETLTREAQERAQDMQQTQLKGRNLVVKLKQTEARLEAAEEKLAAQAALAGAVPHGVLLSNGHPPPPPPPPHKPTAEQEVQCDLVSEVAASRSNAGDGSTANEDAAVATATDCGQDRIGDGASSSSGAAPDGPGAGPLALIRHPSSAVSIDVPDMPDQMVQVDWQAARPQRDAPSAVVAERALASLGSQALREAVQGQLPEGLDAMVLQLARWLPAGPVSGADPVAVMVEEELRLMQSIHDLLGSYEQTQEVTARHVADLQARVMTLTSENDELRQKLELQTQRLELQIQGMIAGTAVSLHQTPAAGSGPHVENSVNVVKVPVSGSHNYQPAQPFLPTSPESESAVATPTRSTRLTTLSTVDSLAAVAPPTRQTWMGYLFRPRQKKRIRSAIL